MESNEVLKTSLENFVKKSTFILDQVEAEYDSYDDPQMFIDDKKLKAIYQVIQLYKNLYEENKVYQRDELEKQFNTSVEESMKREVERFYHFEKSLNLFLRRIDQSLNADSVNVLSNCNKLLKVGDEFPKSFSVLDVVTSKSTITDSSFFFPSSEIKHCVVVLLRHFA